MSLVNLRHFDNQLLAVRNPSFEKSALGNGPFVLGLNRASQK